MSPDEQDLLEALLRKGDLAIRMDFTSILGDARPYASVSLTYRPRLLDGDMLSSRYHVLADFAGFTYWRWLADIAARLLIAEAVEAEEVPHGAEG